MKRLPTMRWKGFRALTFLLLLLLPACQKNQGEVLSSPVLVRIDGRSVTVEEFKKEFEKSLPPDQALSPEEKEDLERSFLVQVIDRELTLAEAERMGIAVTPEEVEAALQEHKHDYPSGGFEEMLRERHVTLDQWGGELREGLLMEKVVDQSVYSKVAVSDEEIKDYFEGHRAEFDRPLQVRARQIVVTSETEGQRILGLLRQGESFEEIARQNSLSPDSENGGDLGYFGKGEMPAEFDKVVFTLAVGRISDLVRSEYGYHIFLVEERREARRLSLDDVRDEIRQTVRAQKEEEAYQEWLQELRARASIEVNWSLL